MISILPLPPSPEPSSGLLEHQYCKPGAGAREGEAEGPLDSLPSCHLAFEHGGALLEPRISTQSQRPAPFCETHVIKEQR